MDRERFIEAFVAGGGARSGAEAAWRAARDERASEVAQQADEVAHRVQLGAARGCSRWPIRGSSTGPSPSPRTTRSTSSWRSWPTRRGRKPRSRRGTATRTWRAPRLARRGRPLRPPGPRGPRRSGPRPSGRPRPGGPAAPHRGAGGRRGRGPEAEGESRAVDCGGGGRSCPPGRPRLPSDVLCAAHGNPRPPVHPATRTWSGRAGPARGPPHLLGLRRPVDHQPEAPAVDLPVAVPEHGRHPALQLQRPVDLLAQAQQAGAVADYLRVLVPLADADTTRRGGRTWRWGISCRGLSLKPRRRCRGT